MSILPIKTFCRGVLLLAFVVFLKAAGFSQKTPPQLDTVSSDQIKSLVIHFQRTGCYGNCPAYKVTIHGDGKVEYEGLADVKVVGKKQGSISEADIRSLLGAFTKANFFSIDESVGEEKCSCTTCTDMAAVITEISLSGSAHTVDHYYGCACASKELFELEKQIDKTVNVSQWTGDVSKQGPMATTCFPPRPNKGKQ